MRSSHTSVRGSISGYSLNPETYRAREELLQRVAKSPLDCMHTVVLYCVQYLRALKYSFHFVE